MELQTIQRRLANVNYTQRHPVDNSYRPGPGLGSSHHQPEGVTPTPAVVRLRHSRLNLLNELDAAPAAAGHDDDGDAVAASTSTAATARQPQSAERRGSTSLASRRRREVLAEFRRRAALTLRQKMPVVRDVNKIDRYSRTAFPVLFIIFNVGYWVYYLEKKARYQ